MLSDCLCSLFSTCFCNLIQLHLFRLYWVQQLCDWFRAFSYCSSMFHLSDCVIGVSWNSLFSLASAGLAIFCCVPTTLTSGVSLTQVWCGLHWLSLQSLCMYVSIYYLLLLYIEMTCVLSMICNFPDRIGIDPNENFTCGCHWQLAGANTALALALTVTSNLLGIFTVRINYLPLVSISCNTLLV